MTRKTLFVSLLVLCLATLALCQKNPAPAPSPTPLPIRGMGADAKLQVRDIQHRQDQILLQIQELRHQYEALTTQMNGVITQEASGLKVDLTKYILDLDTLQFIERPAAPKK